MGAPPRKTKKLPFIEVISAIVCNITMILNIYFFQFGISSWSRFSKHCSTCLHCHDLVLSFARMCHFHPWHWKSDQIPWMFSGFFHFFLPCIVSHSQYSQIWPITTSGKKSIAFSAFWCIFSFWSLYFRMCFYSRRSTNYFYTYLWLLEILFWISRPDVLP